MDTSAEETSRSFRGNNPRATVSPTPLPTSRGKSRRSLKRFINTSLLLIGTAEGLWEHLSDEELKDRLAHVLIKPQGEKAGFKTLLDGDRELLQSFVRGDITSQISKSNNQSLKTSSLSAAFLLERMWRRVHKSLRPMVLKECRRVHRLQVADPTALMNRNFLSAAEFLCISILNDSLINRLQAGLSFEVGGDEFYSAISNLSIEDGIEIKIGNDVIDYVKGIKIRVLDHVSVSLLQACASFYGIGSKSIVVSVEELEDKRLFYGSRHNPPVDVILFSKPALTREARQEKATLALLCKQLSSTLLPADHDVMNTTDPDPEEDIERDIFRKEDNVDDDVKEKKKGLLCPADTINVDENVTISSINSFPWGHVPDLISLHVRTLSEQTFGIERSRFKIAKSSI